MKNPQDVIYGPMITEKSTIQNERKGVYCFKVNVAANKIEIADAIESLFEKVKVASVRTAKFQGKTKRMGRFLGRRLSHDYLVPFSVVAAASSRSRSPIGGHYLPVVALEQGEPSGLRCPGGRACTLRR